MPEEQIKVCRLDFPGSDNSKKKLYFNFINRKVKKESKHS